MIRGVLLKFDRSLNIHIQSNLDLRTQKIKAEIYHEAVKFDKQFKYAEKKKISFAIIIGAKELEENSFIFKNHL